jgi:hypothetical protein
MRLALCVSIALAACNASAPGIACGTGTHLEDRLCVVDPPAGGPVVDASTADGGVMEDAGVPTDLGPPPHIGDPCTASVCYENTIYFCSIDPATKNTLVSYQDCSLLAGSCVPTGNHTGCNGGSYGPCDFHVDHNYCKGSDVLVLCSGSWSAVDCTAQSLHCAPLDGGAYCH